MAKQISAEALRQHVSGQNQASTTGFVKLSLASPNRVILPQVHRDKTKIVGALLHAIRSLCWGESKWPLFIHGDAGVGKTCASLCVADQVPSAIYYTTAELCRTYQRVMFGDETNSLGYEVTPTIFWNKVRGCGLAVLDEIGTREKVSGHHYDCVKDFMDAREGKPAIYVSNLGIEDIGKVYDDRIVSRIACGTVIKHGGKDRRIA